jgi:serine/threonine-protein kinase RsbW
MAGTDKPAAVELRIPCTPEFVGVARLTILGVASRMPFSYDEVEDVRLAIGEACTTAVERAKKTDKAESEIIIRSIILDNKLTIEIEDHAGHLDQQDAQEESPENIDEQSLGALLMELLVDEFRSESTADGTLVKMAKYAG